MTRKAPVGERGWVTLGLFGFAAGMLLMAYDDPKLWETKLFEVILQAIVLTGLLNMVAAFHFASNKGSEVARENTGKMADAITAVATGQPAHSGPSGTQEDPLKTEVVNTTENPAIVQEKKP